jgi:hypothetical protein
MTSLPIAFDYYYGNQISKAFTITNHAYLHNRISTYIGNCADPDLYVGI